MKTNKILITTLYVLFTVLFWAMVVSMVSAVSLEVFSNDGKIGKYASYNHHHSNGYNIPVGFNIKVQDAIFYNYTYQTNKSKDGSVHSYFVKTDDERLVPKETDEGAKNSISFYFDDEVEYFTTKTSSFNTQGHILTKSDNLFVKILQMSLLYSFVIVLTITFYLLKNIFRMLKKELKFNSTLYKYVKYLGVILICKEILHFVITICLSKYYRNIVMQTRIDNSILHDGIDITMVPRLEINIPLIILGLSILVFASLLKAGNQLQQENDLTI